MTIAGPSSRCGVGSSARLETMNETLVYVNPSLLLVLSASRPEIPRNKACSTSPPLRGYSVADRIIASKKRKVQGVVCWWFGGHSRLVGTRKPLRGEEDPSFDT